MAKSKKKREKIMKYKYLIFPLIIFSQIKSGELLNVQIEEERGFALSLASGPLWRNFKDFEKFNLKSDPTITQNYSFIVNQATGYSILAEAKYKFNKWVSILLAATYTNTKKGHGYFQIYNVDQNNERVGEIERQTFRPQFEEKQVDIGNETIITESEFLNIPFELSLYLGYTRNKSFSEAIWDADRSYTNALWRGFSAALQAFFGLTEKLSLGIANFVNPDRLTSISSADSIAGQEPGLQELYYLGNTIIVTLAHELYNEWYLISVFEWAYFTNIGKTIKFQLAESERDNLINPKICSIKENIYLINFGLSKEF